MINVEELLKPIADDKPCGEDFTYHPSFQNLETLMRGKPETQFSTAEEPPWKEVRDAAIEVLGQSKHLTAGVILTAALLKIDGLEGFREGLAVIRGLTEKYWGDVYPKLDADDNNDPTERLNILNNLSSAGEPYKFTVHLKQLVLCVSPALGRITLQQILTAKDKVGKSEAAGGAKSGELDMNQVQAAFRDAGPQAATATLALVNEVIGHSQGIETFIDSTLGSGQGVNFESLSKLLVEMKNLVTPYVAGDEPVEDAAAGAASPAGGATSPATRSGAAMSGTIRSRADVIKALKLIYDYYKDQEPSSPVPLVLQRAERLVDMDFMAIVSDLTPDAVAQLQVITGKTKDE